MQLTPLRNILVLKLLPPSANGGKVVVIATEKAVREFTVEQVGPEVRDVSVGSQVLVNLLVCSQVGEFYLCAEPHVLGTL